MERLWGSWLEFKWEENTGKWLQKRVAAGRANHLVVKSKPISRIRPLSSFACNISNQESYLSYHSGLLFIGFVPMLKVACSPSHPLEKLVARKKRRGREAVYEAKLLPYNK
ncbi:Uncharacterized protein Fot_04358 [Forsythia ovata]|uniref:Uncharacterized protein n=1 Tax=Forsythia ovata TaxID=205694 RepID=A0ABD1XCB6_9LAMI